MMLPGFPVVPSLLRENQLNETSDIILFILIFSMKNEKRLTSKLIDFGQPFHIIPVR